MAYIYLHRRNDTGKVFYVGKGTGDRAWRKRGRNDHWNKVVNKAGYTVEIIVKGLTDEEAFWVEPLLIEAHGGVENLTNVQEGGDRWTRSSDYREKISQMNKERWKDPEYREKKSQASKEMWKDPEYREKMSQTLKEVWSDPELREKQSQIQKEAWKDPELREKLSQSIKETWKDHERREKMSQSIKEMWSDPEHRAKMSQSLKRRVECDRCGRLIGICNLKQHQRGSKCKSTMIERC